MLKMNGTELIDESADVCLDFSGHVYKIRHLLFNFIIYTNFISKYYLIYYK